MYRTCTASVSKRKTGDDSSLPSSNESRALSFAALPCYNQLYSCSKETSIARASIRFPVATAMVVSVEDVRP
jgi:hypothetical protein